MQLSDSEEAFVRVGMRGFVAPNLENRENVGYYAAYCVEYRMNVLFNGKLESITEHHDAESVLDDCDG